MGDFIHKKICLGDMKKLVEQFLQAFLLLGQGPVFIVEFFADPKNEALKTIIPLAMRVVKLL